MSTNPYGHQHQQLRRHWARIVNTSGVICGRCGEWISPTDDWDLDHDDSHPLAKQLGVYNGPAHRSCNRGHRQPRQEAAALKFFDAK